MALPRLAATVCNAIIGILNLSVPVWAVSISVSGTKVISATSLVISIAAKKHTPTSTAASRPGIPHPAQQGSRHCIK